jgi:hypothetical protein
VGEADQVQAREGMVRKAKGEPKLRWGHSNFHSTQYLQNIYSDPGTAVGAINIPTNKEKESLPSWNYILRKADPGWQVFHTLKIFNVRGLTTCTKWMPFDMACFKEDFFFKEEYLHRNLNEEDRGMQISDSRVLQGKRHRHMQSNGAVLLCVGE